MKGRMPLIQERSHRDVLLERAGQVAQVDVSDKLGKDNGESAPEANGGSRTEVTAAPASQPDTAPAADAIPARSEVPVQVAPEPTMSAAVPAVEPARAPAPTRTRVARTAPGAARSPSPGDDTTGLLEPIGGRQMRRRGAATLDHILQGTPARALDDLPWSELTSEDYNASKFMGVNLRKGLHLKLEWLSANTGTSMAEIARQAIEKIVDESIANRLKVRGR